MSQVIYHYDPATGDFTGADMARESPMEPGVFLVPANATTEEPPLCQADQRPVYIDGGWVIRAVEQPTPEPEPSLEDIRQMVGELIKAERDTRIQCGGYPVDGYWFHSDGYSLAQQQGLILAAMLVQAAGGDMDAPLIPTQWQTMGGNQVTMTARLALRLLPAGMGQQGAIFDASKVHLAALKDAADPAGYDFSGGWPKVFGE